MAGSTNLAAADQTWICVGGDVSQAAAANTRARVAERCAARAADRRGWGPRLGCPLHSGRTRLEHALRRVRIMHKGMLCVSASLSALQCSPPSVPAPVYTFPTPVSGHQRREGSQSCMSSRRIGLKAWEPGEIDLCSWPAAVNGKLVRGSESATDERSRRESRVHRCGTNSSSGQTAMERTPRGMGRPYCEGQLSRSMTPDSKPLREQYSRMKH